MKKLDENQVKRNVSFTVFLILLILSFFIFNPAWSDEKVDDIQNQYCWIKGKTFMILKMPLKNSVKTEICSGQSQVVIPSVLGT